MIDDIQWLSPPASLPLLEDEIHIWRIQLDQFTPAGDLYSKILSSDEQHRAQRFKFFEDRDRFIKGRYALRVILARYLSISPEQLQFNYNKYGKPTLNVNFQKDDVRFNLTHSGNLALIACMLTSDIGVDLESIRALPDMERIAQSHFSKEELAKFGAALPENRANVFYELWTCKEAYLKAEAVGLNVPLTDLNIATLPETRANITTDYRNMAKTQLYFLHSFNPQPSFVATVATKQAGCQIHYWQFISDAIT